MRRFFRPLQDEELGAGFRLRQGRDGRHQGDGGKQESTFSVHGDASREKVEEPEPIGGKGSMGSGGMKAVTASSESPRVATRGLWRAFGAPVAFPCPRGYNPMNKAADAAVCFTGGI